MAMEIFLRDAVARWVEKGFGFERRHALAKAGGHTRAVYGELADLGLAGLVIAPDHGGLGFGAIEAMVRMELRSPASRLVAGIRRLSSQLCRPRVAT